MYDSAALVVKIWPLLSWFLYSVFVKVFLASSGMTVVVGLDV